MKTDRTAPLLFVVFAHILHVHSSPVPVAPEPVWAESAGDDPTQEPSKPLVTLSDEEFLELMNKVQRYNDEQDSQDSERFGPGDGDDKYKPTKELERYQWFHKMFVSWERDSKSPTVEKRPKQNSKKKLHKIFGIAGFAIFIITCVITFLCGMLACCGKLDRFCFRRSRGSNLDLNPELTNNDEGLLEYYPEFDSPPAYSDLYCDNYKHELESARLNPEAEQQHSEPESPPPPYTEVKVS